ncbi:Importin subunit alpha [Capsicum baccatum]|uniref:Importin subunit alpha n=1 Tax=Capsicum baccatum TaxID=33114 RepID=A0A2G2WZU2_CAPBA|nr:Importin subunit alpha [Capsicum baccatum]
MMNSPLEDSPFLESFVKGDDSYRNSMFKLIPYLSEIESLPEMIFGVWSDDSSMQLEFTTYFQKLLSIGQTQSSYIEVIQSGVVPRFVEFLARDDYPQLQFEAAWALTNIASGTSKNTKVVIDYGSVPIFIKLLSSPSDDVREQDVWGLGNIASDSPKYRDLVFGHGALVSLLAQFNEHVKLSMLRNVTWTLSNFCRGKPQPQFDQTKASLPTLAHLIHSNDEIVLTDTCWALSYLSNGTNDKIQDVIKDVSYCLHLFFVSSHSSLSVLIPALRTVGNIVIGDDIQTLAVIEAGITAPLVHLLKNAEFEIKKEAAWAISNSTSGGNMPSYQVWFL